MKQFFFFDNNWYFEGDWPVNLVNNDIILAFHRIWGTIPVKSNSAWTFSIANNLHSIRPVLTLHSLCSCGVFGACLKMYLPRFRRENVKYPASYFEVSVLRYSFWVKKKIRIFFVQRFFSNLFYYQNSLRYPWKMIIWPQFERNYIFNFKFDFLFFFPSQT